ncbi:fimbrial biogenesis outer membrane usher protein [Proteus sp. GOKU]|uniref:fimbria/pilus outer membrane usher protein n=1 Tax=Proteus TaxID=583 RepID=UPI001892A970|nr:MULTISPECIES: fimbria/pilus outer membrane usher protein [Proteus]QPB79651.1 fimbrial biogenesis outer membrane usher protein [Proteus sp. GOKU]QQP25658.1 fimbrial biogenesis outer membrane usher protein [Proteus vulgaris]
MIINHIKTKIAFFILIYIYNKHTVAQDSSLSIYAHSFSNIDKETIKQLLENKKPEGFYHSIIHINNRKKITKLLYFKSIDNKLTPCISVNDLISLGIDIDFYSIKKEYKDIIPLSDHSINFKYSFSNQKLNLIIPQKALIKKENYIIDEKDWDEGVSALFSQYSYSIRHHQKKTLEQKLNLQTGLNLGAWRIRSQNSFYWNKNRYQSKLSSIYTYRQINSFSSLFYGGKFSPTTRILPTDRIIGFQLISNNLISSNSLYANKPIIEGIADTEAQVVIKQGDKVLYESTVPPGPFIINSLPVLGSEKLSLEVKEADGRIKTSTHYFTSLPNQLNKGGYQYNFISGTLETNSHKKNSIFLLSEFSYGLSQRVTSYSAIKKRDNHMNYLSGLSLDLGMLGGLATDLSYENSKNQLKYQFRYQKSISKTQTYFTSEISFYHYLDNFQKKDSIKRNYLLSLSQNINDLGYLSFQYHEKTYRNISKNFELGTSFSSSINKINYNLKYDFKKDKSIFDHAFSLNFHIPLGNNSDHYHWFNNQTNYQHNKKHYINTTNIGGALPNYNLGYSVNYQHTHDEKRKSNRFSTNARYQNNYQFYTFNINKMEDSYNYNVSINGGIVLHSNGITLTPRLGRTFALINTQGISGIKTSFSTKAKTDIFGNLILNNITPYRINNIKLNATTLPQQAETEVYSKNVIPTLGSVSKIIFPIKMGYRVIFKSTTPLPFASTVTTFDKNGNIISHGLVSENNIIFLSGITESGLVKVKWGEDKQCQFNYEIDDNEKNTTLIKKEINCI